MKIILGSESKDKLKILESALKELHLEVDVEGTKADSKISTQPLDKEETKQGAVNRAKHARELKPDAAFYFGLEGGLHDYDDGYHLVTYSCLITKDGEEFIGEGEELHLPEEVSKKVKDGAWFGDVIREYAKNNEIDENLITRLSPFTQAVQNSYAEYLKLHGNLGYRKKVCGLVMDNEGQFLLDQLVIYKENDWNYPGGGIEEGETPEQALLREFKEELGTDNFEILKKSKEVTRYDWPPFVIARRQKKEGKTYRGQEEMYFLVRFTGDKKEIKIQPEEIREVRWVKRSDLKEYLNFPDQYEIAERILKELL